MEYYECGCFEVYIAANAKNVEIFQTGRIIGRNDDKEHFGIIESVQIDTDAENGDYLTVSGRFLTSLLSRRIIYPSFSAGNTFANIVRTVLSDNAISAGIHHGMLHGTAVIHSFAAVGSSEKIAVGRAVVAVLRLVSGLE